MINRTRFTALILYVLLLSNQSALALTMSGALANSVADQEYVLRSKTCSPTSLNTKCDLKPHVVFFVHGLTGKDATFHELHKSLIHQYGDYKNLHIYSIDYPTSPEQYKFLGLDKKRAKESKNKKELEYIESIEDRVANLHPFHFAKIMNTKIIDYLYEAEAQDIRECKTAYAENSLEYEQCYNNRVTLNTEYSLIVHSQGGLAAMAYLNTCINPDHFEKCRYNDGIKIYHHLFITKNMDDVRENLFQEVSDSLDALKEHTRRPPQDLTQLGLKGALYAPNLTNMISLGSPFWGSPTANKGIQFEPLLSAVHETIALPKRQVIQLAIGSRGLSWQRNNMLNRKLISENGVWTNHYPPKFRAFNVSGVIQRGNAFDKAYGLGDFVIDWFIDSEYHENDIIVPAPEARLDFIYYLENIDSPEASPLRGRTYAVDSYHPFNYSHVPLPLVDSVSGMTVFLMDNNQYQQSNAFKVIKLALDSTFNPEYNSTQAREEIKKSYVGKLSNFTSEIKLVTPHGYHRPISIVEDEIQIQPKNPEEFEAVKLKNTTYVKTNSQNNYAEKIKYYYWQTYYHIGRFSPTWSFYPKTQNLDDQFAKLRGGHRLNYNIEPLGFEKKSFYNLVMPSYTSYAEVFLKPYLPLAPSQKVINGELILGHWAYGGNKKEFYLDSNKSLHVRNSTSSMGQYCHIGIMGQLTPDRFKHTEKAGMSRADFIKNRRSSIILYGRRSDVANEVITSEWNNREYPVGAYLWNKYARNQNKFFASVTEPTFDEQNPDLSPYRAPVGTVVEVIGRYRQGLIDDFSEIARECSPEEKLRGLSACQTQSIDRYLITSPEIRKADRLKSPHSVGITNSNGRVLGVRWVNVVDVDMLKTHESLPVRNPINQEKTMRNDSRCIGPEENIQYQKAGSVAGYYYRDLESKKLSKRA
ncbi:MAG: hypothetical protein KDD50_08675, partial [Bdellovibrionales bacterium]|nr:hypothetical protein [Bdellovibrionales bacterium]